MIRTKKGFLVFMFVVSGFTSSFGVCVPVSCDPEVSDIMSTHRSVLDKRLTDFLRGIRAIQRTYDARNQICTLEALELIKLKARKRIEYEQQGEITYKSETLKEATNTLSKGEK